MKDKEFDIGWYQKAEAQVAEGRAYDEDMAAAEADNMGAREAEDEAAYEAHREEMERAQDDVQVAEDGNNEAFDEALDDGPEEEVKGRIGGPFIEGAIGKDRPVDGVWFKQAEAAMAGQRVRAEEPYAPNEAINPEDFVLGDGLAMEINKRANIGYWPAKYAKRKGISLSKYLSCD